MAIVCAMVECKFGIPQIEKTIIVARNGETKRLEMTWEFAPPTEVARQLGPLIDAEQLVAEIDEPLGASAPIAFRIARETCTPGTPANDCRAYHAIWQYLRLTGVIRSLRSDGPLFVAAASRRARQDRLRRALICGTADYSMLAYLGHAARQAGAGTHFDVLDLCESTLRINRWYAEQRSLQVTTHATDVFAYTPQQPYDLICTHSFLPWMEYDSRPRLMQRWHDWLAPGGEVCFSNRVDPDVAMAADEDFEGRRRKMSVEFFKRCDELHLALPVGRDQFAELIHQHGERTKHRRHDMPMPVLSSWMESAHLAPELVVRVKDIVANAKDRPSTPVRSEGRPRTWFLARRD